VGEDPHGSATVKREAIASEKELAEVLEKRQEFGGGLFAIEASGFEEAGVRIT
jgi:hypothetical protein